MVSGVVLVDELESQVKKALEMSQAQLETNMDLPETNEVRGRIKAFRIVLGLIEDQRGPNDE